MKVLFDQNTPKQLAKYLVNHQVTRAAQIGWAEIQNGALLKAAEERGFEVLVSTDKNLAYQQKVIGRQIGIVVLSTNNWPILQLKLSEIVIAVDEATPGSYRDVDCGKFVARRFRPKAVGLPS